MTVDDDLVGILNAQVDSLEAAGVNIIILISHLQSIEEELMLASQTCGVDVIIAGGGDEFLTNDSDADDPFGPYPLWEDNLDGDTVYLVTTAGNYEYVGNLIADALRWQVEQLATEAGLDTAVNLILGMQNGGGIRNDAVVPAGPITELNTFDMLPFANFTSVVGPLNAAEFKGIMENSVSNVENTDGRFVQVSGFEIEYDTTAAAENRIIDITLNDGTQIVEEGQIVAPESFEFYMATNSFTAGGSEGYDEFVGKDLTNFPVSYQEALFNYIVAGLNGQITAAEYPEGGEGRIIAGLVTGVFDLPDAVEQLSAFPNPATDQFTVQYELAAAAFMNIDLVNETGQIFRQVFRGQQAAGAQSLQVNVNDLPVGNFWLVLRKEGAVSVLPIAVK